MLSPKRTKFRKSFKHGAKRGIVPHNTLETTYAAIVILFGGLLYPAVVGGIATLMGGKYIGYFNLFISLGLFYGCYLYLSIYLYTKLAIPNF